MYLAAAVAVAALLLPGGAGAGGAEAIELPGWLRQLRGANCAQATQDVSEMYEDLPYPARDPADETPGEPFALDAPSTPAAISHHIYGGALDYAALGRPFRILVAGGGTGDATVMAAVSFYAAQIPVEIVHCDLSAASIDVARRRVEAHSLGPEVQVTFRQQSFLDLMAGDVGGLFDFVNSVGVVHHLASPAEGLRALVRLLRPEGGLFLMVYGELGRTGVYDIQNLWRLSGLSRRQFLGGPLQALLQHLPETNRLARNTRMLSRKVREGDLVTLSDLLAHNCDHAYTVASLLELLAEAGLRLLAFAEPERYEVPEASRAAVAPLLAGMDDPFQRAHFAELLRADAFVHIAWAAPGSAPREAPEASPAAVICPAWRFAGQQVVLPEEERAKCLREAVPPLWATAAAAVPTSCTAYLGRVEYAGLPCPAVPLLAHIDCATSVQELALRLIQDVAAASPKAAPMPAQKAESLVLELYDALLKKGQQQVFLLRTKLHFRRPPWRQQELRRVVVRRDWAAAEAAAQAASASEAEPGEAGLEL